MKGFGSLYLALVHYPVLNRRGDVIASAVTNLDLHDLARCSCTYGVPACFIVTPLRDQQALVDRLMKHWCEGIGKELLPDRERALRRLRLVESIEDAKAQIFRDWNDHPKVWASTAKVGMGNLSFLKARSQLVSEQSPVLLLLGTGWGLESTIVRKADAVLEPIEGSDGYNHLSVRCAAAIMLDRLLHHPLEQ